MVGVLVVLCTALLPGITLPASAQQQPQPPNRAYVTNQNFNNVLVIDTATNAVITAIPVGVEPNAVAGPVPAPS